jgi:peptidoglycan/LPS O-acetylase OafA/YrhL
MGVPGPDAPREAVPDVVAPPPRHPRFPLTVGLRGVPAIAILIGHAWYFNGGFGGFTESIPNRGMVRMDGLVALFFLLSGFLLYRPMIAHRTKGAGAPRVADYAKRRFLRLYPAYWVVLVILAIVPGLYGVFGPDWWKFFTLTDFFDLHNAHNACPIDLRFRCGIPQSWTLGVDMSFYLVLPFYAAGAALLARGRAVKSWMKAELGVLALLAATSLFLQGPPFDMRHHDTWFRFSFLGHFYWFALGMGIAVISVAYWKSELPRPLRFAGDNPALCWAVAFAIYLVTLFGFYPAPFPVAPFTALQYVELNLLQGIAAVFLFLPAVFSNPNRGVPARVLGHPVLMWFGLISYGILLWHVTIAVQLGIGGAEAGFWIVLLGGLLLTVPLAATSYYLVERPLMKLKYQSLRQVLRERARRHREPVADSGPSS